MPNCDRMIILVSFELISVLCLFVCFFGPEKNDVIQNVSTVMFRFSGAVASRYLYFSISLRNRLVRGVYIVCQKSSINRYAVRFLITYAKSWYLHVLLWPSHGPVRSVWKLASLRYCFRGDTWRNCCRSSLQYIHEWLPLPLGMSQSHHTKPVIHTWQPTKQEVHNLCHLFTRVMRRLSVHFSPTEHASNHCRILGGFSWQRWQRHRRQASLECCLQL